MNGFAAPVTKDNNPDLYAKRAEEKGKADGLIPGSSTPERELNIFRGSSREQQIAHDRYIKVQRERLSKVKIYKIELEKLRLQVLNKDPITLTREEQLSIATFRLRLQRQLDSYNKRQEVLPYTDEIQGELIKMRDELPKHVDFIDREASDRNIKENARKRLARYKARQKVGQYGIKVRAPGKRQGNPQILQDNPPAIIAQKRARSLRFMRMVRARAKASSIPRSSSQDQGNEVSQSFSSIKWGRKKQRN